MSIENIAGFADLLKEVQTAKSPVPVLPDTHMPPHDSKIVSNGSREEIIFSQSEEVVCLKGLSMRGLLNELMMPIRYSMNQQKLNSLGAHLFGSLLPIFDSAPEKMKRKYYQFCDKTFFVMKDSAREAYVYDLVMRAAMGCSDETFWFPFVTPVSLEVPVQHSVGQAPVTAALQIDTLTFTEDELKYLQFSFIREVKITYLADSDDCYKNAKVVFRVNRELLTEAPYQKG